MRRKEGEVGWDGTGWDGIRADGTRGCFLQERGDFCSREGFK